MDEARITEIVRLNLENSVLRAKCTSMERALAAAWVAALEEAAKECEEWASTVQAVGAHKEQAFVYSNAAIAIRALKAKRGEDD